MKHRNITVLGIVGSDPFGISADWQKAQENYPPQEAITDNRARGVARLGCPICC